MKNIVDNRARARRGADALNIHSVRPRVSGWKTSLWYLLTDLMHYADQNGVDFKDELDSAYRAFDAEKKEKGGTT